MKKYLLLLTVVLSWTAAQAQRFTDQLDRGLVVVPVGADGNSTANFVSWRQLAHEYYGVTYNVYKNGTRVADGISATCYNDASAAPPTTQYQVAAVVNGVEQEKSPVATAWNQYVYKSTVRCPTGYIDINLANVYDRDGNDVTDHYSPNDAEMADLDGDGQLELIIKRLNTVDAAGIYLESSREFVVLDAYDVDWQTGAATLLWRIDCGPNMASLNSTEINIIAYDWDEDGKAEVVLRGADDMVVYGSDGTTKLYTIGTAGVNTRGAMNSHTSSQYAWTQTGAEYLVYMNGATGALYQQTEYPLKRLEAGESDLNAAWGDAYGHRSTKHFMGAPFLDGRKASLFLGRGIYTRHKFIAMDLNRAAHTWSTRWTWNCNDKSSPWYGNGYHNFVVADVDEDGRDEIVYGSMVIDDNGCGLSTTGYGHGDAQHVGDFDPYRKGLEMFACLEDYPYWGSNYRNATTGEVYYKYTSPVEEIPTDEKGINVRINGVATHIRDNDDGRCLMDNFTNDYPGSVGRSVGSDLISSITDQALTAIGNKEDFIAWSTLNFRIYFDGDLCSEIFNGTGGANGNAAVIKPGTGRLFTSEVGVCQTNNDSKHNACFIGDIIGDWREEIVMRRGTGLRVYTTGMTTNYAMPSLWYDHEYRQAMVWQMMAYNQPPHLSYFLGEMEGITVAPPPVTNSGRVEVSNNGTIGTATNGRHLMMAETRNMTVSVAEGASPQVFTDNAPSWVQGTDVNGTTATKIETDGSVGVANLPTISRTTYTHTLTGSAFTGATQVSKQGDGTLVLPTVTQTYSGPTKVWAGTLQFDGTMDSSPVWMNRHTVLNSTGGTFLGGITMEYGSTLHIGTAAGTLSTVTASTLQFNFGARVVIDVNGSGDEEHDWLNADVLTLDLSKADNSTWQDYGPEYLVPVIEVNTPGKLSPGRYTIGHVTTLNGDATRLRVECTTMAADHISVGYDSEAKELYLTVTDYDAVNDATIAVTGWQPYKALTADYPSTADYDYYLPIIGITATETNGTLPTLSGTFTNLSGTETDITALPARVLWEEDYEEATGAADWSGQIAAALVTGDATYGNYVSMNNPSANSGNRYRQKDLATIALDDYVLEFDVRLTSGSHSNQSTQLVVGTTSIKSKMDSNAAANAGFVYSGDEYVFSLLSTGANSTTFYVDGDADSHQGTLSSFSGWHHVKLTVKKSTGKITYEITKNGASVQSKTHSIKSGHKAVCIYALTGRNNSDNKGTIDIDHIRVTNIPDSPSAFVFTEPGTLRITSSLGEGASYVPTVNTFEALLPYYRMSEDSYLPVSINDELATILPQAVTDGNAMLLRSALTTSTSWATMVLPFDLTAEQVRATFGDGVTVANMEVGRGDLTKLYFETESGVIHANQPFLIKDVTKDVPYLIMGVTVQPVETPIISNGTFSFIGHYTDQGQRAFYTTDLFFTASGGLSRVGTDGLLLRMKGYRGYFQTEATGGGKIEVVFDETSDEPTAISPTPTDAHRQWSNANIYNLNGQLVRRHATTLQGLPKGVYICRGQRLVVK